MTRRFNLMTRILLVASLVVLAAFTGFSLYIDVLQRGTASRAVEEEISSTGAQAAQSIANWMNARIALTEMAADAAGRAADNDGIRTALQNGVLTREFITTYVGDEAGTFTTWPVLDLPAGYDPRTRPWYKDAVTAGTAVLTEPYADASTNDLIISSAAPIMRDGKLFGVAGSDFSLKSLVAMIGSVDIGGKGSAFLVNSTGTILVHPDQALVSKTLSEAFPDSVPALEPAISRTNFADADVLVSFIPLTGLKSVNWHLGVVVDRDLAFASVGRFQVAAIFATIIAVILMTAVLASLLSRMVVRPVSEMTRVMGKLASGDLQSEIPGKDRKDEIGDMAAAVDVFKENALERRRLEEQADENRTLSERERHQREAAKQREAEELQQIVAVLADGLGRLSNGDLVHRIDTPFEGDLDRLRIDFNESVTKLNAAMASVGQNATAINAGASEIRTAADNLAHRTEQQAASVEQTAAALEEITTTVKDSARRAEEVGSLVARTRSGAEKSGEIVNKAVQAMQDIEKSSGEISNIIGVIDDIAFQTNLLALNAGVEAARAGDAGRGFAVVAQEVRELAQRSANAAKEIKTLITASGEQVRGGVALVNETGGALEVIVREVQDINGHVNAIVTAAREQSTGLQEINMAVNTMDQGTQQNAAMVEEQTAASHGLAAEAAALNELLSRFVIDEAASKHANPVRSTSRRAA
ncbi:methyl-accepting chemotaxis protein [Hoeflea sp. YIM 152468]|uniref:methyl-accepting chemotaxis protein McpU n=1 Tax=Hoeflea sp. YIM 152468 TaxID=3031759 RepID=UPI0023DB47D2|nr:methyl-accepting chemotaxis protein [Hoeflea sp. YIM 152468]MDF1608604.1 methyl-accepting chemotaxis protein [Hoeflea sp. YIM 152468]